MKLKKWQSMIAGLAAAVLLAAAPGLALPAQAAVLNGMPAVSNGAVAIITFDACGGTGTLPGTMVGVNGLSAVIPEADLTSPEAGSGLRFVGWATNAFSGVPEYLPGDTITLMGSQTLYAVYSRVYIVEFRVGDSVVSERVLPGFYPAKIPDLSGSGYAAWADSAGWLAEPFGPVWEDRVFTAVPDTYVEPTAPAFTLKTSGTHENYMNGGGDGLFHPADSLTRAELAQMLYAIVEERPETIPAFSDVAPDAWYAPAVEAIAGLGIMDADSDGSFRPGQAVTRAECAAALSQLIPPDSQAGAVFPDVPEGYWAYDEISRVSGYGLFRGDETGNFNPDSALSRAEAVTVFNRLLGRTPDAGALATADNLRVFPDVPTTHWAYSDIMEATVSHETAAGGSGEETWSAIATEKTALADGWYCINGWLYCVKDGVFLHGAAGQTYTDGVYTFDENGRYTTGNAALDWWLNGVVREYTNYPSADAVLAPPFADGWYCIDGWLYRVKNGVFLCGTTDGAYTFDGNGRYTTGNAALDQQLNAVVKAYTNYPSATAVLNPPFADGYYCIDGWLYCVKNGVFLCGTTDGAYTFDENGRYTTGNAQADQQLNAVVKKYYNNPSATAVLSPLADGFYRIDGRLYRVKNGVFLCGTTDGVFTFDVNGRYTTGNAELDQRLNAIVEKYTNSSMTRDQKLRALYNYVRDNFTYLSRPHVSKGQTGWEPEYALFFLQNGKGNCFSFSATYCLLCRELGLPAYTVVGGLGKSASPHGWVEIVLDGTRYMFDTQLEWRYLHDYGKTGYNLFKMIPGQTPFTYTW